MSPSQVHQLPNILSIILGAIENGNLELAKQAVHRAEDHLASLRGVSGPPDP
jgi:hypothetical protein